MKWRKFVYNCFAFLSTCSPPAPRCLFCHQTSPFLNTESIIENIGRAKMWSEQKNSRVTNVNSESTKLLASTTGGVKFCQVEEGWRKGVSGTELWKHLAYLVGGEDHGGRILMSLLGVIRSRGTKDRLGRIVKALYAKIRSFGLFRSQWTSEKCFPNLAENHDHLLSLCVSLSFSCCMVERSSCGEGVTTGGTLQQF